MSTSSSPDPAKPHMLLAKLKHGPSPSPPTNFIYKPDSRLELTDHRNIFQMPGTGRRRSNPPRMSKARSEEIAKEKALKSQTGLQRMYGAEEWSDLKIITPTKVFSVHKAVLCPAWPYVNAACTRGFVETASNEIKLPEEAEIIEAILRHFYEWSLASLACLSSKDVAFRDKALFLIRLAAAVDKYGVADLANEAEELYQRMVQRLDRPAITEVGVATFAAEGEFMKTMKETVVQVSSEQMVDIIRSPEAWQNMLGCQEYLHQALLLALPEFDASMSGIESE